MIGLKVECWRQHPSSLVLQTSCFRLYQGVFPRSRHPVARAMIRVGLVGLGRMGSGMALNIAKAGFPLSMYDAEEGRAEHLRESWTKNKDLPPGERLIE